MREIAFVKQNKEKWLELETLLQSKESHDPELVSKLYIQIMNDLGYAQTYYPHSSTTIYLNQLASELYLIINEVKPSKKNFLLDFYGHTIPSLMIQYRTHFLITLLFCIAFFSIGSYSTIKDPLFSELVLGQEYIDITTENIRNGDPMAIYQNDTKLHMSLRIMLNNLQVSAYSFISGLFTGLGTFYVLANNFIMIGAFQTHFYNEGFTAESLRGIWLHGTFEVLSIALVSGTGFIMGTSFIFPKTFSRTQAFKAGFKDALKIYLSCLPFIIIAAFIEGFITRYAKAMPDYLNYLIIGITFIIFIGYYAIFPWLYYKMKNKQPITIKS